MGYLDTLAAVQERLAANDAANADRPKTDYFGLKDGEDALVAFAQELDKTGENYSEKNGTVRWVLMHTSPDNWKKKAECTADEGGCYGCENGWRQQIVFYVNLVVDNGDGTQSVKVFNRGTGEGSIPRQLMEYAADDGTITDKWWKIKRNGEGKSTTYTLMPKKEHGLDLESFELFDLDYVPFKVKYEKQTAYYTDGVVADADSEDRPKAASATGQDTDW